MSTPTEPYPCTGQPHQHRWLRFGQAGERDEATVIVEADGTVTLSEQLVNQLMRDAGYLLADPDSTEIRTMRRLAAARSTLLAGLPGRNHHR